MIAVSARIENDIVEITVEDNGVGMTADRIANIFTSNDQIERGYGLHSVNTRIKLYYGPEYGITFDSLVGLGTTAIIRIPAKFSLESPE
jgi:two-component system sensor histidine kinase YesM